MLSYLAAIQQEDIKAMSRYSDTEPTKLAGDKLETHQRCKGFWYVLIHVYLGALSS
jgi:hypothetical protein